MPQYVTARIKTTPSSEVTRDTRRPCAQDAHKRSMKDHLFTTGRRNIKVVDPKLNTRGMSSEEI
jgi:hypothetical protein